VQIIHRLTNLDISFLLFVLRKALVAIAVGVIWLFNGGLIAPLRAVVRTPVALSHSFAGVITAINS